jgi:chaperonin cofactor prefoldin
MTTTTEKSYIFNLETGKIELHFDKAEYQALTDEQKRLVKSNFLFSRYSSAWVSRAKEPNLFRARKVAEQLGFTQERREGERLSFAEQVEKQAERAERRAERFEGYANNAERRAEGLQKELNSYRGDSAFLTQPIIAGHSGSQAFAKRRERIYNRYNKGFDEYKKSEYFKDRAATARNAADMKKFKNPIYLDNRIKECKKNIRALEKRIKENENNLERIENGEIITNYKGEPIPAEVIETAIDNLLERLEAEIDKQGYMENCLDEIGGNRFSKENIKPGYIVKMHRWGKCEIISTGPVNVKYKILEGGAAGMVLKDSYAAIVEIIEAKEEKPEAAKIENPFKEGEILCGYSVSGSRILKAYQVVKVTATGVKIQQIKVEDNKPMPGQFTGEKAKQRKVVKSKFSDFVGVYDDDWQLHKYTGD